MTLTLSTLSADGHPDASRSKLPTKPQKRIVVAGEVREVTRRLLVVTLAFVVFGVGIIFSWVRSAKESGFILVVVVVITLAVFFIARRIINWVLLAGEGESWMLKPRWLRLKLRDQ
jgi:hypothetical protein